MQSVIQKQSGLVFSIKTFRPLWVFSWTSSIWRQIPMATCLGTVMYRDRQAAEAGHQDLCAILNDLKIGPAMREPFLAVEAYAKKKSQAGVKSYRIYEVHAVEGQSRIKDADNKKV